MTKRKQFLAKRDLELVSSGTQKDGASSSSTSGGGRDESMWSTESVVAEFMRATKLLFCFGCAVESNGLGRSQEFTFQHLGSISSLDLLRNEARQSTSGSLSS